MGFKKLFKIKPPEEDSVEVNRERLQTLGIETKNPNSRKHNKFAAYGVFAKDRKQEKVYAPQGYEEFAREPADDLNASPLDEKHDPAYNPYQNNAYGDDPYSNDSYKQSDPYGQSQPQARPQRENMMGDPHRSQSPHAQQSNVYAQGQQSNPYAQCQQSNPYSQGQQSNPYAQGQQSNSYVQGQQSNSYAQGQQGTSAYSQPSSRRPPQPGQNPYANVQDSYGNSNPYGRIKREPLVSPPVEDDLNNSIHEDDDLNASIHESQNKPAFQTFEQVQENAQKQEQQEEDEEVESIKQQIKFTKQSSVASTRNTLKMAQDAEMAGMNTMGMLGHQSEKLYNIESNLRLADTQNRIADDSVKELKKLNRSILAVHVSNPFNSKRRARETEEKIKTQRIQDKLMQQELGNELYQSTQRVENVFNGHGSQQQTVREKYQQRGILDRAKRYQFEADEEDDEMETEIDQNLDKIAQISSRLRKLAVSTGEEIDSQHSRIKKIEEDADSLDIKVHMNTTRLNHIR